MPSVPIDQVITECHRALKRGDTVRVVGIIRELARQAPQDPRTRMLQGIAAVLFNQPEQAIKLLEQVTFELAGEDQRLATIHLARARVLVDDTEGALATIEPILGEEDTPAPGLAIATKAEALIGAGRLDEAQEFLDSSVTPENQAYFAAIARARLALATPADAPALLDRRARAIEMLTAENEHVGVPAAALAELLLLLGELRACIGEDSDAAHLFKRSAGLNPIRIDPRPYAKSVMDLVQSWNEKNVARARRLDTGPASETQRPIFIVGMPGGGPELASRLLAAHPEASETDNAEALTAAISHAKAGTQSAPIVSDPGKVTGKQLEAVAGAYLERTDPHDDSILRVVDANALNLHVLGVVAQLFPNARVVFVRRDPFDACFGCMMRHTDPRLMYSHDPRSLVIFAGVLRRLEEHWIELFAGDHLPMRTSVVDYRDLLAGGEVARGLYEFAGLGPVGGGAAESEIEEHARWTGHGMGLRERFATSMPELVSAVEQVKLGEV